MLRGSVQFAALLIGASVLMTCWQVRAQVGDDRSQLDLPIGLTLNSSGYGTLLHAEPSVVASESTTAASGRRAYTADDLKNPPREVFARASALERLFSENEQGNYVGLRVAESRETIAFYFRKNASSIVERYAPGEGFEAVSQGVPVEELQPILDEWMPKLIAQRLFAEGSVDAYKGRVEIVLRLDKSAFDMIAREQGWQVPEGLRFHFAPPISRSPVDSSVQEFLRIFPVSDRSDGAIPMAASYGRIILRDGCFRVGTDDRLVLFPREAEVWQDDTGHLVVGSRGSGKNPERYVRIGESVVWAGPIGVEERDAGVIALREACGGDPIEGVGRPSSTEAHPVHREAAARSLTR